MVPGQPVPSEGTGAKPGPACLWSLLALTALLVAGSPAALAAHSFDGCAPAGDARSSAVRALNRLKNRALAPRVIDRAITLRRMLRPGPDARRWRDSEGASVVGYVLSVHSGGVETANCRAHDARDRDTHIELVLGPREETPTERVVVEVTPRWRARMRARGFDWSTRALARRLTGHWVRLGGWMMFDREHRRDAAHTAPGRRHVWRATAWEIHPVTSITVLARRRTP